MTFSCVIRLHISISFVSYRRRNTKNWSVGCGKQQQLILLTNSPNKYSNKIYIVGTVTDTTNDDSFLANTKILYFISYTSDDCLNRIRGNNIHICNIQLSEFRVQGGWMCVCQTARLLELYIYINAFYSLWMWPLVLIDHTHDD